MKTTKPWHIVAATLLAIFLAVCGYLLNSPSYYVVALAWSLMAALTVWNCG